jgi:hypothetical protein
VETREGEEAKAGWEPERRGRWRPTDGLAEACT